MLITDSAERRERHATKVNAVLRFLGEESYSNAEVLATLLALKTRQPLYRLLNSLEKAGLISKRIFEDLGGKTAFWELTMNGIAALDLDDLPPPHILSSSPLTIHSIQRHLFRQKVRLALEAKGATNWSGWGDPQLLTASGNKMRVDGAVTLEGGQRVAIKQELTIKTPGRYQKIIYSHLDDLREGNWQRVYYVLPDAQKKRLLANIFQKMTMEAQDRDLFCFFTLDELEAA